MNKPDMVNSPPHYTYSKLSAIDVVEDWNLPFHLGQVLKYIQRHRHKGAPVEDLKKAQWYLNRYTAFLEKEPNNINELVAGQTFCSECKSVIQPSDTYALYHNGTVERKVCIRCHDNLGRPTPYKMEKQ